MTVTISLVGNRFSISRVIKKAAKEYGIITKVQLTRIGFFVWHLQFDADVK